MIHFWQSLQFRFLFTLAACFACASIGGAQENAGANTRANRFVYLDEADPFYVGLDFPKLTTPQWVGEPGVEAVVVLAIDDMREHPKYETFLRPILEKLKQVEGRAALSIMCNALDTAQPHYQTWLKEGLSLEVHTLSHPCPLLAKSNFVAAAETYHGGVDLLNHLPDNKPVAYRMPCCDSINSPSPRFYTEIFSHVNKAGQFLTIDSSVMNILTPKDKSLPRELVLDADGREKFRKYLPFPSFVTTIEDYPYPYVIGRLGWEFPAVVPSDWEAQNIHKSNNPITVADWKAALDATLLKQGTFNLIFHPHGWIRNDQIVELIEYVAGKYGKQIKFLNFREAQERLDKNLLAGHPLRAANGQDNGARLVDLNNDGYLDVVIGNEQVRKTRLWNPVSKSWSETSLPAQLVTVDGQGHRHDAGVKFGVVREDGFASIIVRNETTTGAWHFDGKEWIEDASLLNGLDIEGQPVFTRQGNHDRGVRLRDVDNDGRCELIVGNENQNAVFAWSVEAKMWKKLSYALPGGSSIVDSEGRDNGLRLVDVNEDGYADVIFSNEQAYSFHLFVPKLYLGFQPGWTREVVNGQRGSAGEIPRIVRGADRQNNGVWFHSRRMWVQNEETAHLPDLVDRRSFDELLGGLQPPAKSPLDSLAAMRVRPGFKVELVAAEPLVKDPIAFEWGADGKLWVVEMGDYPLGFDGQNKSGGIVRFLEDTDSDGRYDKSTVFLEGVNFPTGVLPWRKGVLVSAAPEIFYAEDTNGDGKADVRKVLFTGFREGNQQHRVNGFEYGLDNWIYGANGDSGGEINSVITGKTVSISGRDFRFRPDDGAFEAIAGQTQYGRRRDDWGNWFGNNNPNWLWHYHLPLHYLTRNPHLAVRNTRQYLANYLDATRVFAASRLLQRFNDIGMANHVTSGNSATPYRDELFGPDFATSVFISEPVHNVVHREVLESDGVTFTSHRAAGEQTTEFLASTDNWFRPITLKTGPDGALYIADMYRLVLEHPEWIPKDTQKTFNLRAGDDKGRIYRVYPTGATLRRIPRLDQMDKADLVAALDSSNGWQRDTAQRLLVQSGDKTAGPPLQRLLAESPRPQARLQALCTLDGLGLLTPEIIVMALKDAHSAVRENAVRLSEPLLATAGAASPRAGAAGNASRRLAAAVELGAVQNALLKLVNDPSIRVRYQLAFTLGEWQDSRAAQALARLAIQDIASEHLQTAVMSSAPRHVGEMLTAVTVEVKNQPVVASVLENLLGLAAAMKDNSALASGLGQIAQPNGAQFDPWQFTALAGFLDALERRDSSLKDFQSEAAGELRQTTQELDGLFTQARARVEAMSKSEISNFKVEIAPALRVLGRGLTDQEPDIDRLAALLRPQFQGELANTALASLARLKNERVADVLLVGWNGYGPALRTAVTEALFTRPEWLQKFLAAVEAGKISAGQISLAHQQKLLTHSRSAIREPAEKLFAAINTDRRKILDEFQTVGSLTGSVEKGAGLFRQNCAMCHRFRDEGNNAGPDLGMMANKSAQTLLVAILDPNQAVEARYLSYTAVTQSGRELSGIIAAETPNSLALRNANGIEEVVLRTELKELNSSGLSLMPEGLEKTLKPQDLADLIAYLTSGGKRP